MRLSGNGSFAEPREFSIDWRMNKIAWQDDRRATVDLFILNSSTNKAIASLRAFRPIHCIISFVCMHDHHHHKDIACVRVGHQWSAETQAIADKGAPCFKLMTRLSLEMQQQRHCRKGIAPQCSQSPASGIDLDVHGVVDSLFAQHRHAQRLRNQVDAEAVRAHLANLCICTTCLQMLARLGKRSSSHPNAQETTTL